MFSRTTRSISYFITPMVLAAALFVFAAPHTHAKIVVDGDREFTDDVNNCLNTYRNTPGIVGDTIRGLESSKNEHKVIKSPDWTNTSNDLAKATGGSGSGTVTRVDKVELDKYKKEFPELANKDFCTALLHEMWHAVDADKGTRTNHDDKVDGVKRNEIEATLFQNFIHAIRGVPARTSYGGVDISKHVLLEDQTVKEEVKEPEKPKEVAEEPKPEIEPKVATSFNHVAPGQYSEIYAVVTASPGAEVKAVLTGPGVDDTAEKTAKADGKGTVKFTWRIVSYGVYSLKATADGQSLNSQINVK